MREIKNLNAIQEQLLHPKKKGQYGVVLRPPLSLNCIFWRDNGKEIQVYSITEQWSDDMLQDFVILQLKLPECFEDRIFKAWRMGYLI